MKMTGHEFIVTEQERCGDSDARTAQMLGMSQPGYYKAKKTNVSFKINDFVRYCHAAGYEVVVMPKEYVGILNDKATIIDEA